MRLKRRLYSVFAFLYIPFSCGPDFLIAKTVYYIILIIISNDCINTIKTEIFYFRFVF